MSSRPLIFVYIRFSTAVSKNGSDGAVPLSTTSVRTVFIHRSRISGSAPPSGFAFTERLRISSRYVASPCPFVPISLRSGERSASAAAKPLSITCWRIVCKRKLLPLP